MLIRYINASDDRMAISRIYEESWRDAYRGIIPQDYLDAIPRGQWASNLDTPGRHTMVCIVDGAYVGTSSFCKSRSRDYADSGEVISIYLLPSYMGRGYGTKLLRAVLGELRAQGFLEVFLWVLEDNRHARRFYERNGFSSTSDYLNICIGGKDLREVRYVRRIDEGD